MVILEGNEGELDSALRLIRDNPNPDHVEEYYQVMGERKSISTMIDNSISASCVVGYAEKYGEAFTGGVELQGFIKYQIWMLSTAGAGNFPRWLLREAKKLLTRADSFFEYPCSFYQVIPESYPAGLRFVKHLGFVEVQRISCDGNRSDLIVVERSIPRWVQ